MSVDKILVDALKQKEAKGNQTQITPINNDSLIFYNSVNLAVGKQGAGKSLLFLREVLKIQKEKNIHLLVYVTSDGETSDETFLAIKNHLTIPVLTVSNNDVEEVVEGLLHTKDLYNDLVSKRKLEKLIPTHKEQIKQLLHLKEFPRDLYNTRLHTVLLFDDAAFSSLFKKDDSYFNKLVHKCRHANCIFMFATQKFKGLSMPVKSQATTLMIYPGFTPQEVSYIYHNATIKGFDFQQFKALYSRLLKDQVLYCNAVSDEMKIIDMSHIRNQVEGDFEEEEESY